MSRFGFLLRIALLFTAGVLISTAGVGLRTEPGGLLGAVLSAAATGIGVGGGVLVVGWLIRRRRRDTESLRAAGDRSDPERGRTRL